MFNTDQGSQFRSREFTQVLQDRGVKISMDGKGRYQGNIFVERLWRTVKYEEVYLKAYVNAVEPTSGTTGTGSLLPVLQQPETLSGSRLPDPCRSVPRRTRCPVGRFEG